MFWVLKALLNFYDLEICIFQNFSKAYFTFQIQCWPITSLFSLCPSIKGMSLEKKKIKVWYRQEDRHPNKTPKWILLVSICPCDYLMEIDMFSSSMQDSLCHERSVSTSELGSVGLLWLQKLILTSLHPYMKNWTQNIFIFLCHSYP